MNIVDEFLRELVAYAREIVVGDPLKPNTRMGPVNNKQHYDKIMSYIDLAAKSGCKILCGETVE